MREPSSLRHSALFTALFSLGACSAAAQSGATDPEAQSAFVAYGQCLADVAEAVQTNAIEPAVTRCFGADLAESILSNLEMTSQQLASPPTNTRLVGSEQVSSEVSDTIELHVLAIQFEQPSGFRVTMVQEEAAWKITRMHTSFHSDRVEPHPGAPPIETEVHVDGAPALDEETGVWTTTNAGYSILSFTPWFDGPELQIDNLRAISPSQSLDSNYQGDFSNAPDRVQVRYRDDTVNSSWDLRGSLTVDDVTAGRMTGSLRLELRTLIEGPIEVEVRFAHLPVP